VTAKAEHVGPLSKPKMLELREAPDPPAGDHEPAGMIGNGQMGDLEL
jgi:hypothetical protein